MTSATYPVFLNLQGRHALVVGGGAVAVRKANALVATGCHILAIAPEFAPEFTHLQGVALRRQPYARGILPGAPRFTLVFAATNQAAVNADVAADAAFHGILCTRADQPDDGDFSNGAVHHQPGVTIAISTRGSSPTLAGRMRDELAKSLDPLLPEWSHLFAAWRTAVLSSVSDPAERRLLLQRLAGPEMETILRAGGPAAAQKASESWITTTPSSRHGGPP